MNKDCKNNIYSFPVSERKPLFLALLSMTKGSTEDAIRREKLLKTLKGETML